MKSFTQKFSNLSKNEQELMCDLDLNSKNLLEKYHFYLNSKEISEKELDLVINIIRNLRSTENENKGQ